MLADFDYTFNQHDVTIHRAEENYKLTAALSPERPNRPGDRPKSRLSTLLRRIAGTPATA